MNRFEMLWDCKYCGTKGLLGVTHRHCVNCGANQDPKARYFRGSPMDGSISAPLVQDAAPISREHSIQPQQVQPSTNNVPPPQSKNQTPVNRTKLKIIAASIVFATAALIASMFITFNKEVLVTQHKWSRSIDVETFTKVHENSECSKVPHLGEVTRRYNDQRSERVYDGQDCNQSCSTVRIDLGDGSFSSEEQCNDVCTDRYRTEYYTVEMCDYDIGRWLVTRTERVSGALDQKPEWPHVTLASHARSQQETWSDISTHNAHS